VKDQALLESIVSHYQSKITCDIAMFTELIRQDRPPHVGRFGDGEMRCALNFPGANCDRHDYSRSLGQALLNALITFSRTPDLWLSNWFWYPLNLWVNGFVSQYNPSQLWCSHELFMHLQCVDSTKIRDAMAAIRDSKRRKVLVRPNFAAQADKLFKVARRVEVMEINGWQQYGAVRDFLSPQIQPDDLVLLIYGMPAKPLMAHLIKTVPSCRCIDLGSALDPLFKPISTRNLQITHTQACELYAEMLT
jgi:hypothetical protein